MFLRKLARESGREDWWNLADEMTPFQVAVLQVQEELSPTGEERADMRAAVNTAVLASTMAKISDRGMDDIMRSLTTYTEFDRTRAEKHVASPAQAAAIFGSIQ